MNGLSYTPPRTSGRSMVSRAVMVSRCATAPRATSEAVMTWSNARMMVVRMEGVRRGWSAIACGTKVDDQHVIGGELCAITVERTLGGAAEHASFAIVVRPMARADETAFLDFHRAPQMCADRRERREATVA